MINQTYIFRINTTKYYHWILFSCINYILLLDSNFLLNMYVCMYY